MLLVAPTSQQTNQTRCSVSQLYVNQAHTCQSLIKAKDSRHKPQRKTTAFLGLIDQQFIPLGRLVLAFYIFFLHLCTQSVCINDSTSVPAVLLWRPTRFSSGHAPVHVRKTPFGSLCTLDYQLYANYSYELTVSQAILLSSPLLPFSVISNDSKFSGQRKSNKYYHSTQALHSSYSLPIDQRIQFKIGLIVHRALYLNQPQPTTHPICTHLMY